MHILRQISGLTELSTKGADYIRRHAKEVNFRKGDLLVNSGESCRELYFVKKGLLRGFYYTQDREVTNWFAAEGDIATSYYAFITGNRSPEMIEALEDGEAEALSGGALDELYRLCPEMERAGRLLLEDYYMRLEERVLDIQFRSARERYDSFCNKRPAVATRAPLGSIASYLGMTQETLSRIRR
jgi:CRP-like cAMP-binding protein